MLGDVRYEPFLNVFHQSQWWRFGWSHSLLWWWKWSDQGTTDFVLQQIWAWYKQGNSVFHSVQIASSLYPASVLHLLQFKPKCVGKTVNTIETCSAQTIITLSVVEHHKSLLSRYLLRTCAYLLPQIAVTQEDFIMLPGPSQDAHRRKVEHGYSGLQAQASRENSSLDSTQPPVQQVTPAPWLYRMRDSITACQLQCVLQI